MTAFSMTAFLMTPSMSLALVCIAAVALDALCGEPRRAHPLVAFGRAASALEAWLNHGNDERAGSVMRGLLAMLILVLPAVILVAVLSYFLTGAALWCVQVVVLWSALALRSLAEHGQAVSQALMSDSVDNLANARERVARIVSRDTASLDETGVAKAATESMLENGADAVFATLFWFVLAGLPGVVLHRTVNTLDAMWGYRTARFERFGKSAARFDDVLNWLPARFTALTFALCALFFRRASVWQSLRCWWRQARYWESPNAGPVMAAGAGAIGVQLGGGAPYHGGWKERPVLGVEDEHALANVFSITAAIRLVRLGVAFWLILLLLAAA